MKKERETGRQSKSRTAVGRTDKKTYKQTERQNRKRESIHNLTIILFVKNSRKNFFFQLCKLMSIFIKTNRY